MLNEKHQMINLLIRIKATTDRITGNSTAVITKKFVGIEISVVMANRLHRDDAQREECNRQSSKNCQHC